MSSVTVLKQPEQQPALSLARQQLIDAFGRMDELGKQIGEAYGPINALEFVRTEAHSLQARLGALAGGAGEAMSGGPNKVVRVYPALFQKQA